MQYILSEDEYQEFKNKSSLIKLNESELQELCTKIAQNMPVESFLGYKAWGCVIAKDIDYCDYCPVKKICPYKRKRFSK